MLRLAKVVFALILVAAATEAVAETHLVGLAGQSCQTWTANHGVRLSTCKVRMPFWVEVIRSSV
jgi:hypothetical protein